MLDHLAAFTFFFKQKGWFRRLLIASLLTFTIIGMAPVLGWCISIARRVAHGQEPPLPPEDDWKTYWTQGGKFALVNLPWLLPFVLLELLLLLPAALIGRVPDETVLLAWVILFSVVASLMFIYSLVYMFFIPAMIAVLAQDGTTRQAMNPLHLARRMAPRISAYALVFLIVGLGLTTAAGMLASISFFLLTAPLLVYVSLVTAHYSGQLARPEAPLQKSPSRAPQE